ncbi:MAG: aminotransferase class I/II-fold pyridoxal phosphate-dependent enzyme [Candidatus Latescibacteria bacterium]|jgi:histidinol-phosphate aminotransferase|nr:aminotransferase class I/II-fold pyridoxal phosphate-dependent enzyme [Candidatus Latescibacterota bacterium]
MQNEHESQNELSRRGFLKGALLGGAALTLSPTMATAQQMLTGSTSVRDIRSIGLAPGRVDLSLNENPNGPSIRAIQAAADNLTGVNRYTRDSRDLEYSVVEALADYDGVTLNKVEPASSRSPILSPYILTYMGSSQFLKILPIAYLSREGGDVVDVLGGYTSIQRTALAVKEEFGVPIDVTSVPLTSDYRHDLPAMLKAVTPKTRMVVITNPNNPTGTLLSYEEIEAFVKAVPKDVIVVIDEAYIHFGRDVDYQRAVPLAIAHDNVIVVRTFSKGYGLAGIRMGYSVCSQAIQDKLRFYMSAGFPPVLPLSAALESVKDLNHLNRSREMVWAFHDRCYEVFDRMGVEYLPGQGNFFMVNVGRDGDEFVREMFKERVKVAARNRDTQPTWIRVSAGTAPETEVFLNVFQKLMIKS